MLKYFFTLFLLLTLSGCDAMKPTPFNFTTLQRSDKPNSYLVCPKEYCHTKVDATAPIFNVSVIELQKSWDHVIQAQPRIESLAANQAQHTFQYVQRSLVLRFPDIINITLIPINKNQSTLAIYSTAVYGYYDFNVNKKRVQNWLAELGNEIKP